MGRSDGYSHIVRARVSIRWVVAAFIVVGVLIALALIVRDLDDEDTPEETGTTAVLVGATP